MMECPEYRSLRNELLYPILLELNNEHKRKDRELFVQILTTKHCDLSSSSMRFKQEECK